MDGNDDIIFDVTMIPLMFIGWYLSPALAGFWTSRIRRQSTLVYNGNAFWLLVISFFCSGGKKVRTLAPDIIWVVFPLLY